MPPGHSGCLFRVLPGQFEVISSFPNTKNTNAPKLIVILFEIRKKKQAYEKYSRSKEKVSRKLREKHTFENDLMQHAEEK